MRQMISAQAAYDRWHAADQRSLALKISKIPEPMWVLGTPKDVNM